MNQKIHTLSPLAKKAGSPLRKPSVPLQKEMAKKEADRRKRFWERVNKLGPLPDQSNPHYAGLDCCWIWEGAKSRDGYGQLSFSFKPRGSHQFSYIIHHGEIPSGKSVLHICDNPSCVNPDHLWSGSSFDNMKDKQDKGRSSSLRGELNPRAKLSEPDVRKILSLKGSMPMLRIARLFGVSDALIRLIFKGKLWSHIEIPKAKIQTK